MVRNHSKIFLDRRYPIFHHKDIIFTPMAFKITVHKTAHGVGKFHVKRFFFWIGTAVTALFITQFISATVENARLVMHKKSSLDEWDARMETQNISDTQPEKRSKVILIWSKFVKSKTHDWNKIFSRQIKGRCPHDCTITYDRKQRETADAIIFKNGKNTRFILPPRHHKNQIWILFSIEAPTHNDWKLRQNMMRSTFDWTMTYHSQSDVVVPYGRIIPRNRAKGATNSSSGRDYWSEKRKQMAKLISWMVSNCPTPSQRENFVRELQRYENVDIYGNCGPLKCGGRMILTRINKANNGNGCYDLMGSYMFYLALENSICDDYVTEKFFRALQMDAIPVVYGGGNYNAIGPPHSYINAMDFESPLALVKYLRNVAENQTLYNSYFDWKRDYNVELGFPFNPLVCDLCTKLHGKPTRFSKHGNSAVRTKTGLYKDASKWFTSISKCKSFSSIFFTEHNIK